MSNKKKYSARARPERSPRYSVRGKRKDGSRYEFSINVQIEPPAGTPVESLETERQNLKTQADHAAELFYRAEWGLITPEELEAGLKGVAKRVMRQNSNVTVCYFFVAWVWEYALRGKQHPTRVGQIVRLVFSFLHYIGPMVRKPIHDLRPDLFETFMIERRMGECSQKVANDEVALLKSIGKDIKELTSVDLTGGLELEVVVMQERLVFKRSEIDRIFEAVWVKKVHARDWKTFLLILLYTQMRPEDGAIVQRKDVDLEAGLIKFRAQKLEGYGKKLPPKPMHRRLWAYLKAMLSDLNLGPDDFICPSIAAKMGENLNKDFLKILNAARVDPCKGLPENRKIEWSGKSLYSMRNTGITWIAVHGASDDIQKLELGDSTTQALRHYQHPNDPLMQEAERRRVNAMPDVSVPNAHCHEVNGHEQGPASPGSTEHPTVVSASTGESEDLAKRRRWINTMDDINVEWRKG